MHNIDVTVRIKIADGPELKEDVSLKDIEAYGEVVFKIEPGAKKKVEVQPSAKGNVVFLLIKLLSVCPACATSLMLSLYLNRYEAPNETMLLESKKPEEFV